MLLTLTVPAFTRPSKKKQNYENNLLLDKRPRYEHKGDIITSQAQGNDQI